MENRMPPYIAFAVLSAAILFAPSAQAQTGSRGSTPRPSVESQDPYRQQMESLMRDMRNAKTPAERKAAHERLRQVEQQWRAAHPAKEPTAAEKEERRRRMEDRLKKDPDAWQMYQLHQSMVDAKTPEERKGIQEQIKALDGKRRAEAEAKLTPAQQAARQARQERAARMRAELAPLAESLGAAKTDSEKAAIRARMDEVLKKNRIP